MFNGITHQIWRKLSEARPFKLLRLIVALMLTESQ